MADTTTRALSLLNLLQTHRHWPGTELARRLGVTERTVRRDVERLRELGYRIESAPGVAGGYRLEAGSAVPPLLLTDEEAVVEQYAVIARDNHSFARFNKIGLDPQGDPDAADLHRAWAAGARVLQLTLR